MVRAARGQRTRAWRRSREKEDGGGTARKAVDQQVDGVRTDRTPLTKDRSQAAKAQSKVTQRLLAKRYQNPNSQAQAPELNHELPAFQQSNGRIFSSLLFENKT